MIRPRTRRVTAGRPAASLLHERGARVVCRPRPAAAVARPVVHPVGRARLRGHGAADPGRPGRAGVAGVDARWPTPADLAAESPGEVVRAWGRLGYPRRALRLREAAVAISRAARRGGARRRGGAAGPARRRRLHGGRGHGVRVRTPHHGRRHQRAAGAGPGGRGPRARGSGADRRRSPPSRHPSCPTPCSVGHLERRGHGARRAGLPARDPRCERVPGAGPVRLGRCRSTGPRRAAAPGSGVARHRPAGARGRCSSRCATPRPAWRAAPRGRGAGRRPRSTAASPRSSRTGCSSRPATDAFRLPA